MPSCKSLIRSALTKAPAHTLALSKLRDQVVAALVQSGKSNKKATRLFNEKVELPIFKLQGSNVKLADSAAPPASAEKRKDGPSDSAVPAKKSKASDGVAPPSNPPSHAPPVKMMSEAASRAYCEEHRIEMSGPDAHAFRPLLTFADAGFSPPVLKACEAFAKPTPIQAACWPVMMSGRDVVGVAETGSGKTLAFFLPAMMHCAQAVEGKAGKQGRGGKEGKGGTDGTPRVLVLAPTRELAMQSDVVCREAGARMGLVSVCIYGGVPKATQRQPLREGAAVVVATPGRLLDLVSEESCTLSHTTYLVLDEADRMLDMGFEKDVRSIISMTNPARKTVMFTATWPESIRNLAAEFLRKDFIRINVGAETLSANHRVTQEVEVVEQAQKESRLSQLLQKYHASRSNRVLVFALYKNEVSGSHTLPSYVLHPLHPSAHI